MPAMLHAPFVSLLLPTCPLSCIRSAKSAFTSRNAGRSDSYQSAYHPFWALLCLFTLYAIHVRVCYISFPLRICMRRLGFARGVLVARELYAEYTRGFAGEPWAMRRSVTPPREKYLLTKNF